MRYRSQSRAKERQPRERTTQNSGWVKVVIDANIHLLLGRDRNIYDSTLLFRVLRIQEGDKALDTDTSKSGISVGMEGRVGRKVRYRNRNIVNFQVVKAIYEPEPTGNSTTGININLKR